MQLIDPGFPRGVIYASAQGLFQLPHSSTVPDEPPGAPSHRHETMTEDQDAHRNYVVLLREGVAGGAATELTSVQLAAAPYTLRLRHSSVKSG